MAKTALLVTYVPRTRVIVDVPNGMSIDQYLENDMIWSKISRIARNKMQKDLGDYLYGDNMEVEEDIEVPAKESEVLDVDP